jgi:glutamate dehydrogenase
VEEAAHFAARIPAGYQQQVSPAQAANDLVHLAALDDPPGAGGAQGAATPPLAGAQRFAVSAEPGPPATAVGTPGTVSPGTSADVGLLRLRRYGRVALELSSFLPVLESFGLVVVEAVPMAIAPGAAGEPGAHIDDFGLRRTGAGTFSGDHDGPRLVSAIEAATTGATDVDSLNRLVLAAGLDWVQVRLLRAYRRYRRQAGSAFSDAHLDDPLVAFPAVARGLVDLVEARFDPRRDEASRAGTCESVRAALLERLADVQQLEQDQVLRGYLALVDATLRTSYFLHDSGGAVPATLTLKLDSRAVPELPLPRPEVEAFVHGPAVEGIHLRFGRVARGGLRWSDRPDDFRTEILGLAAAQVKKNAVIVPTGAKGGFVCRRPAAPSPADVKAGYEAFVSALLDITDNLVDGAVVTPAGVVARDGEDPYFVVAADRGTATFSDTANALSEARHFWLGDAFASGGSHGYDHKAMGITARGAWVATRRHFHQLGIDVQTEMIRVAGVGDMSGDVFGNGMLQSEALALVAAFDHRHIFIDPDPDPASSYAERRRMAALGRSSWADYDRAIISKGGGVWPRDVKSVPLSPPARRALGVSAEELSPPALISAILRAPVDLLWFGGIGTYIKASDEPDTDVGDHANDAVRVTADQVRARVIAEGGNLGVTQRGRIRYSRRGGRINTDFIDNAAGVATSDREVNLKILIDLAIRSRRLEPERRDELLAAVQPHVATEVLRQIDHSVAALTRAVPASARDLDAYESLLLDLEASGLVDRAVEDLPDPDEFVRRRAAGAGLIRPELAVVLSYAKSDLLAAVERSGLPDDAALRDAARPYFPPEIVERFDDLIPEHRLYPQLVATDLAGDMVDQMGPIWAHETAAELGVSLADVAGAYWSARQVLDAGALWTAIASAGTAVSAEAEAALHRNVVDAVGGLARRYLALGPVPPAEHLADDAPVATGRRWPDPDAPVSHPHIRAELERLAAPTELIDAVIARLDLVYIADVQVVAHRRGVGPDAVFAAFDALDRAAGIGRLAGALRRLDPPGRWATWQVRALLDEVATWRAAAVDAILGEQAGAGAPGTSGAGGAATPGAGGAATPGAGGAATPDVGAAVEAWVARRSSGFDGLRRLLDGLAALDRSESSGPAERAVVDRVALASILVRRLPR